ncbi:MAG: 4-hydroxy-tetrahydrodipicolinate reductase [Candidatus Altiarchaeota archaeon]|nr:4-hydroxy-tetrahydrodipicolinate reductase [Candidatus Altiarchaeota archaeon]MBU4266224.1 4-hydroxy-tetrahydrodipicolinate reductase [Candidatus Altiarchaeota archaeon]
MAIKIAMLGMGRMGREIVRNAAAEGMQVVAAVDSDDSPSVGQDAGTLAGISPLGVTVTGASSLAETLYNSKPDVVVDFSSPEACVKNSAVVCEKKINMVIGTTGLSDEQLAGLKQNIEGSDIGAVISPNMSVGVNVFWELVREATGLLKDYDIEITEAHHRFKKDAPSGTAKKTAEIIAEELNESLSDSAVYGREGIKERQPGEIGIHAIRAGDIVGEHTVLFGTLGERVEITHRAHSRGAFSSGVIRAAEFIDGKKGIFSMADVLGLK